MLDPLFSVVIPTHNRLPNLKHVLIGLEQQVDAPPFEVIVADDGSTDGTRQWMHDNYVVDRSKVFTFKYQWCGPNLGFRTSRTRNIGIAQAEGERLILLDSDVVLNPRALHEYGRVHAAHPDIVIVGMYHFAAVGELKTFGKFDDIVALVPDVVSKAPPVPGWDSRRDGFHETFDAEHLITEYDGLGFLSGNISWPTALWWRIGGQEERMPGHGNGEDAELGQRMRLGETYLKLIDEGISVESAIELCVAKRQAGELQGLPVLQYAPIWGVHLPHPRDQGMRQRTVQDNIAWIDRRYGIGTYAEITDPETDPREKDLSIWYTRAQGGRLVKKDGDPTVYAVDGSNQHYVGIPTPHPWFDLLELEPHTATIVEDSFFEGMVNAGTIRK